MSTEGSGASRGGGEGLHNEDVFLIEDGLGLYVVCDGVGATPAGEVAARVATDAVEDFVERARDTLDLREQGVARRVVSEAIRHSLEALGDVAQQHPEVEGLATTVTLLLTHGDLGVVGHCGDSRAYLIRDRRAHQLTIDHELTTKATNGSGEDPVCDVFVLRLEGGDTLVLCTDGAEDFVDDAEIVRGAEQLSPRLLASRIVGAAHRRRPEQDATAVVVRVGPSHGRAWIELSSKPRRTSFGHTLPRV